jgi:hypothetical protein
MDNETDVMMEEGFEVPASVLLGRDRGNRYGSVPGLDDSELVDPAELERQVLVAEFGPVLALPVKTGKGFMRPSVSEDGVVDWGAFGSVDFDRYTGGFDKARYKADKVREQLKDVLILFSMVQRQDDQPGQVPGPQVPGAGHHRGSSHRRRGHGSPGAVVPAGPADAAGDTWAVGGQ